MLRVLVLTTFDLDEYVYAALRAEAIGFLLKDVPPADLLAGIRVVALGQGLLAPTVTPRVIAEFARRLSPPDRPPARGGLGGLIERDAEVLTLIARGLANPEIGDHLRLRLATVKSRRPPTGQTGRPRPGAAGDRRLRVGPVTPAS